MSRFAARAVATAFPLSMIAFLVNVIASEAEPSAGTASRGCVISGAVAHAASAEEDTSEPEPPPPAAQAGDVLIMEVSGYTSEKGQTDARPCEAADLTDICARKARGEHICASNRFPLGTRLKVQGLGPCTVADRTSSKYADRVDWYFGKDTSGSTVRKDRALEIGVKEREVRVLSLP